MSWELQPPLTWFRTAFRRGSGAEDLAGKLDWGLKKALFVRGGLT